MYPLGRPILSPCAPGARRPPPARPRRPPGGPSARLQRAARSACIPSVVRFSALAPLEPGAPFLDAPARAGAREDASDAGVDRVEVTQEQLEVEVQVFQQVHLVNE